MTEGVIETRYVLLDIDENMIYQFESAEELLETLEEWARHDLKINAGEDDLSETVSGEYSAIREAIPNGRGYCGDYYSAWVEKVTKIF